MGRGIKNVSLHVELLNCNEERGYVVFPYGGCEVNITFNCFGLKFSPNSLDTELTQ